VHWGGWFEIALDILILVSATIGLCSRLITGRAANLVLFSFMQQEPPLISFLPQLSQRFQSLVWSCLDSDLTKTAVFHAERYYALDQRNHDSRHIYATALLREGQIHSALTLVNISPDLQCSGCLEIKARCCTALGRHRQAREALEATLRDPAYIPIGPF